MNPLYEPNEFEKAENVLNNFKDTYFISDDNEAKILSLLENYFETKANGSPIAASEIWAQVQKFLVSCESKK